MRAIEALSLAIAFAFVPELPWVSPGLALEPHPGWLAVLVLSARYGSGGFFAGLTSCALAVGLASAIAGTGLADAWGRLDSHLNLMALGASLIVAWIASCHSRRQADLGERLRVLSDRAADAEAMVQSLREVAEELRSRIDRTSASLSFIRDVAARLDGTDPVAAAEGAVDLALARTGASAAAVKVGAGEGQRLLVFRDVSGPGQFAHSSGRSADLSVPIPAGGKIVGVIALWGLPHSACNDATAHDLAVIASWCGPALETAASRPVESTRRARVVA